MTKEVPQNLREIILHKVKAFPESLLEEVYQLLLKLEKKPSKKERILSFAGSWTDLSDQMLDEFTQPRIEGRRASGRNRREEL